MHERMQRYAPHPALEQETNHRPGGGIFHHFVNTNLVSTRATFEEEVVKKVELEVSTRKDVCTRPGIPIESTGRAVCPEAMK
jgi:hypothetical protein